MLKCSLVGAPVECGASQPGCVMGPDALRTAGIVKTLEDLGHVVTDHGNVASEPAAAKPHLNTAIHDMDKTLGWASALKEVAYRVARSPDLPIFLGGDHSIAIGTVPGVTRAAQERGVPQFVLWLDAHPDIHTLETTDSGNLHGTPVAYFTGQAGFDSYYPALEHRVDPQNVCMMGLRSVDPAERAHLSACDIAVHDMRSIDENGVSAPLIAFLDRVSAAKGSSCQSRCGFS